MQEGGGPTLVAGQSKLELKGSDQYWWWIRQRREPLNMRKTSEWEHLVVAGLRKREGKGKGDGKEADQGGLAGALIPSGQPMIPRSDKANK